VTSPDTAAPDTAAPAPAAPRAAPDHRPGQRAGALALVAGGLLFALGNALHPLDHSDAATRAPTWAAAHLTFALGALLLAGGVAALGRRLAASRVGVLGMLLAAAGMVVVVGSAYVEVYVAPAIGHAALDAIDRGAALWGVVALLTYVVGPVLVAAAGLRHRRLPAAACVAVLLAQVVSVAGQALPVPEGVTIIPATVVLGLAFAALGWSVRGDAVRAP
jgi:hypothetical protein